MATRSIIAWEDMAGRVELITCHWDGYVRGGVGEVLHTHYQEVGPITELMGMGNLAYVRSTPSESRAYGAEDKGEVGTEECQVFDTLQEFEKTLVQDHYDKEYLYVFHEKTGEWEVTESYWDDDDGVGFGPPQRLKDAYDASLKRGE